MIVLLTVGTGCASVEVSPPISSCHNYVVNSGYGRFIIQQARKGASISWGAYPNATYSGTYYTASVYANGVKIDGKSQNYAPHASISAARATKYSGKLLKIAGNVTKGKDLLLHYEMVCRIM